MTLWWGMAEAETNRSCFRRASIYHLHLHTKGWPLACSGRNLQSYFLKHPGCKLHFRQMQHVNPRDKRYMPFLPTYLKDFGKVKVRQQQPGLNGEDTQHLSTRQALMGNSGRAAPLCQAHAGISWPGGKAVFEMKSSLCFWHSFLFVSDYGFGIEFAFWKKKTFKGEFPFQTQA